MVDLSGASRWLHIIAETSSDAIVGKTRDGRITYWSPGAVRLFGYSVDEAVGRRFSELLPPLDDVDIEAHRLLVAGERIVELEQVRLGKGGTPVDVALTATQVLGEDSAPIGTAMIFRDIRGRKRLEAQMRHADRLSAVGTLAASIAHDMNGPLSYALLGIEALERSSGIRADRLTADTLTSVREGVERIHDLVRDLRIVARFDSSRRTPVDVKGTLELALRMSSVSHRARARIVTRLNDVHVVRADGPRLAQVFINLLINAADALADVDDRERIITVELDERDGRVVATVADNGQGMPLEVMKRAFEPFFTTKAEGHGTGLGLAICRSIVEDLGGSIEVASTEGEGTTVGVLLPRAAAG
jgi:two-component system, NtrC family, sensor kinase